MTLSLKVLLRSAKFGGRSIGRFEARNDSGSCCASWDTRPTWSRPRFSTVDHSPHGSASGVLRSKPETLEVLDWAGSRFRRAMISNFDYAPPCIRPWSGSEFDPRLKCDRLCRRRLAKTQPDHLRLRPSKDSAFSLAERFLSGISFTWTFTERSRREWTLFGSKRNIRTGLCRNYRRPTYRSGPSLKSFHLLEKDDELHQCPPGCGLWTN